MKKHWIAVRIEGRGNVKHPYTGDVISAYQIPSHTCGRTVLVALYGDEAVDGTLPHHRFHYVHLTNEVPTLDHTILLHLTDEELARVEGITRAGYGAYSGCWRWMEEVWKLFPSSKGADYIPLVGSQTPRHRPDEYPVIEPKTAPKPSGGIQVERDLQVKSSRAWWWVSGETYPHRHTLKAAGGEWSKGKKAWLFRGEAVPTAVQELLTPAPVAEELPPVVEATPPTGTFKVGDRVQAKQAFLTVQGTTVPMHTHGIVQTCCGEAGELGFSYDVDFSGQGETWCFECDLEARLPAETVVPLAPIPDPDLPAGLPIADEPPVLDPVVVEVPLPSSQDTVPLAPEKPQESLPTIRVLKPEPLSDMLDGVIASAPRLISPATATPNPHRVPIRQTYVGELSGAIAGNVHCYGYALHQGTLLYVNMGGPRRAVEAIRARLAKGETVNLLPWDAPSVELSAGEEDGEAQTGKFTAYLQTLSEAKFTSALLVHEWITTPLYHGLSVTAIFRTSEEQAIAKLLDHVRKLVKVAVFDQWGTFLYTAGQAMGLVRPPTHCGGEIDLLVVDLDDLQWTRLLTGGLSSGRITLPTL